MTDLFLDKFLLIEGSLITAFVPALICLKRSVMLRFTSMALVLPLLLAGGLPLADVFADEKGLINVAGVFAPGPRQPTIRTKRNGP